MDDERWWAVKRRRENRNIGGRGDMKRYDYVKGKFKDFKEAILCSFLGFIFCSLLVLERVNRL